MKYDLDSEIVQDGDAGLIGFRSRPDPMTLGEGVVSFAQNMRFNRGRAEVRRGAKRLAQDVNPGRVPLTLPFLLGDTLALSTNITVPFDLAEPVSVEELTRSGSTVTATLTGHGLDTGATICISGADQAEYNGDHVVTVTDADTFTFTIAGFPASPATGTIVLYEGPVLAAALTRVGTTVTAYAPGHGLATGDSVAVQGAAQDEYNGDHEITVLDGATFTFEIDSEPATPATGSITIVSGPVVRNSYSGGIFAAGVFSSPKSSATGRGDEYLVLVGSGAAYLWREGKPVVQRSFPAGETVEEDDEVTVLQAFDRLFILRAKPLTGEWIPQALSSLVRVDGTATATFGVAHGLEVGDRIAVEGTGVGGWDQEFDVASTPTSTTLTFAVSHTPTTPAPGTITIRKVRAPLVWDGGSGDFQRTTTGSHATGATYSHLRGTGIATYFNNQLVVAPTPARDSVLVSDVLDYDTFDPLLKSFRANTGSADRIVALHPFAERDVLVFMRNSIYRAHIVPASDGVSISTADSFVELLTTEVGCRARRSVVTAGPYIYFLADQGVYRMDLNYSDLKVRGMQVPLSDAITDILEDVNDEAMHQACGAWFDNRYWLAVPVGDSPLPNCLLVWSALTGEWESKDVYPVDLHHLLVSDYGGKRRLFGASRAGTLFLLEELERVDDAASGAGEVAISAEVITRAYWQNDMAQKRFVRGTVNVRMEENSAVTVSAMLSEPDLEAQLATLTNAGAAEDHAWKFPIRRSGHNVRLRFRNTQAGRWTLRNFAVHIVADRPSHRGRTVQ